MDRLLKARQSALDPVRKLRDIRSRLALHHRHRTLSKLGIVQRDDKHLVNLRVCGDNTFQRFRLDPLSSAEKEIVYAA